MAQIPYNEARSLLEEAETSVPKDRWYYHYKGDIYRVIGHVVVKDTAHTLIHYVDINNPDVGWVTSMQDWQEPVDIDGELVERYRLLPRQSE